MDILQLMATKPMKVAHACARSDPHGRLRQTATAA